MFHYLAKAQCARCLLNIFGDQINLYAVYFYSIGQVRVWGWWYFDDGIDFAVNHELQGQTAYFDQNSEGCKIGTR